MSARAVVRLPLPSWKIEKFHGGLSESATCRAHETPDCRNVVARMDELLEKRGGTAKLNTGGALPGAVNGLHAFYMGSTRLLFVAAADGKAYQYSPATRLFTAIKTGISASNLVQFATTPDYMVAFDGATPPWKTDGITVTDLANAPATGKLAEVYASKLFTVPTSDESTLYWSGADAFETWPVTNMWPVDDRDGDVITALKTYKAQDHLAVFKRKKVFAFMGQDLDNFALSEARAEPGAVGPGAIVEHGGLLYYVSEDGICAYNGLKSVNLSRRKLAVTWATVNDAAIARSCAGKWNGLLWFGVPTGSSAYPNLVIVYDPETSAFWPMSGINPSVFATWNDGNGEVFLAGSGSDGYVRQLETGTTDDGTAISAYWWSPVMGTENPEALKKLYRAYVANEPDTSGVTVAAFTTTSQKERATALTLTAISDSDTLLDRYDFPNGSYAHYVQMKLAHASTTKLMKVRSLSVDHQIQPR